MKTEDDSDSEMSSEESDKMETEDQAEIITKRIENGDRNIFKIIRPNDHHHKTNTNNMQEAPNSNIKKAIDTLSQIVHEKVVFTIEMYSNKIRLAPPKEEDILSLRLLLTRIGLTFKDITKN